MVLSLSVYCQLLQCPQVPPETGGILGSRNNVIDTVVFDQGKNCLNGGTYVPDVRLLNKTISQWAGDGIVFSGLFHTHVPQWPTLSGDDKKYIKCILMSMPLEINCLYFPLVFPGKYVRGYAAQKTKKGVCIIEDDITIV